MAVLKLGTSQFYSYRFMYNGKIYQKSTRTANKQKAMTIEASARMALVENEHLGMAIPLTIKQAFSKFLTAKKTHSRIATYKTNLNKLVGIYSLHRFGGDKTLKVAGLDPNSNINDLTLEDVGRIVVDRRDIHKHTNSVIRSEISMLFMVNDFIATMGYPKLKFTRKDVVNSFNLHDKKKPIIYLTADEQERLLQELDPENIDPGFNRSGQRYSQLLERRTDAYDLTILLLDIGGRINEVQTLTWDKIDFDNKTIHLVRPKVSNQSFIRMTDRVESVLVRRRLRSGSTEFIFEDAAKTGVRKYSSGPLKRAAERAGIKKKVSFHTLRRSFASTLVKAGLDILATSKMLGHTSVRTTEQMYADLAPLDASDRAVDILNKLRQQKS